MSMRRLFHLTALLPLIFIGCGEKNKIVLDTDDMASLMADIHIAEAVVNLNHNDFDDDSSKMLLKQSIYAAHGVTAEQVDSSYKWYGHHVEDYMEVYEKTIKILNERQGELLSASSRQVAAEGDSVDIWPMSSRMEFSRQSPSRLITFSIPADSNWQNNDVFTLRFNMASAIKPVTARMVVEYADGTSFYNLAAGKNKGKGEVSLRVDSTLSPIRIAGYIITHPEQKETVRIDSISLVRMRSHLFKKYFSQRPFKYGLKPKPKEDTDSSTTASDSVPATGANTLPDAAPRHDRPIHGLHDKGRHQTGVNDHKSSQPQNTSSSSGQQVAPKSPGGGSTAQEGLRKRDELIRKSQRK